MMADTLTRPALLHALIAEDAEALKLIYRLFLEEGIETKRLVHVLQPFDQFTYDWDELLLHPRKKFKYYEEVLTGEALRIRLLKEDADRIGTVQPATWPSYCAAALNVNSYEKNREDIGQLHLLLAFFYALQPGAFSFSVSDLLGMVGAQKVDLMKANENTLYASLPGQLKNPKSFALQLRKILDVRREQELSTAELLAVPQTKERGLMILIHRLRGGMTQLLALNFGRSAAEQVLEMPAIRQTTAIDLMTGLAEKKPLESSTIRLSLPPLSGKIILFQTKYHD
jgi:maltose alpha-D-glucosyltransferase/alpha-amylase